MNLNLNRTHAASPIEEHKRQKLIPFPRVGKRQALIPFPRTGKRQSGWLIPFPRTGKRSGPGAPGPPGAAGTVADFLQQLEREREEAAHSQPTLAGAGGAASMKGQSRHPCPLGLSCAVRFRPRPMQRFRASGAINVTKLAAFHVAQDRT